MREFIGYASFFIAFLTIPGAIIGLISPAKLVNSDEPIPSRLSVVLSMLAVFLIFAIIGNLVLPDKDNFDSKQDQAEASSQFDTGLRGANIRVIAGSDNGIAGGTVAKFVLPVSKDEAKYLNDMNCLDESECYGDQHFYQFIVKSYPDIAKIDFPKRKSFESLSKHGLDLRRYDFYRAVYLAKRINLANGQTLFDFITKCSKGFSSVDAASFDLKDESIQFFPILRRLDNDQEEEMQIVFDRSGDQVKARSPWFSTHIMQNPDFMKQHGLRCWNTH